MFDIGLYEILLIVGVAFFLWDAEDFPRLLYRVGATLKRIKIYWLGLKNQGRDIFQEMEIEDIKMQTFNAVKKRDADAEKSTNSKP